MFAPDTVVKKFFDAFEELKPFLDKDLSAEMTLVIKRANDKCVLVALKKEGD